jgi:hypothetical protein
MILDRRISFYLPCLAAFGAGFAAAFGAGFGSAFAGCLNAPASYKRCMASWSFMFIINPPFDFLLSHRFWVLSNRHKKAPPKQGF